MSVVKFRSEPEFETRLCTSCLRKGDPDPYWPIDRDSWPVLDGKFSFKRCKACEAEKQRNRVMRRAANDDGEQVAA